jgi:hypothetical protein
MLASTGANTPDAASTAHLSTARYVIALRQIRAPESGRARAHSMLYRKVTMRCASAERVEAQIN